MSVEQATADHVARALERIEQLEAALEHRTVIGRAQGILMERYAVDEEAAFEILKRASNTLNVKLFEIASSLVETRRLPDEIVGDQ
jgi:AmiR/NasT family two-component response regulator